MTSIFGHLNVNDRDRAFVGTVGQALVFTAVDEYFAAVNADFAKVMAFFIEEATENYKERYKLMTGGRLQARDRLTPAGARKTLGSWDVAYPLWDFGEKLVISDVDLAYMTMQEFEKQVKGIVTTYINTFRYELQRALYNSATRTFTDPDWGSLTIQPLANNDGTLYPPILGKEAATASHTHYIESGYTSSSISNSNNPIPTIVEHLEEHFGEVQGGENIVVLAHRDEVLKLSALSSFVAVPDNFVIQSVNTAVPTNYPSIPGKIVGRMNGAWISQWRWQPSGYLYGQHMDAASPLKLRQDPAATGLGTGLQLKGGDDQYPLVGSEWRVRFGVGVANRLNGVSMELSNGGTYDVPSGF